MKVTQAIETAKKSVFILSLLREFEIFILKFLVNLYKRIIQ